jgi:type VI secretion system protein ImpF
MVRRQLMRDLEAAVRLHEPRLDDVRVTLLERDEENRRSIRFVIEALLRMEPNPERVVFDTVLETSSGTFSVDADTHA